MNKSIILIISITVSILFSSVYNEGDVVSLVHQNQTFSVCSGDYYLEDIKLSDFNGELNGGHNTIIMIDMSASW
tara:strand:- start:716 stop:937 length:222 start_codon:yes stop_codon:yes gene_type:complete